MFFKRRAKNDDIEIVDLTKSEKPYILTEAYYLFVILFIGVPMWFMTCSSMRYSLPKPNLELMQPHLHLDISIVQGISHVNDQKLRANLQESLSKLESQDIYYNINWRVRRPTIEENRLLSSITARKGNLVDFEKGLKDLHRKSYSFRLLIFLLEDTFCDGRNEYLFGMEPYIYICPDLLSNKDTSATVDVIKAALIKTYLPTVDIKRVERILSSKANLLVTLIHENGIQKSNLKQLTDLSNQFHEVYNTQVKNKFIQLAEILNIRFITKSFFDMPMTFDNIHIGQFFKEFLSQVDEPLESDTHHMIAIVRDKPSTAKNNSTSNDRSATIDKNDDLGIVETSDSHFVMHEATKNNVFGGLRSIVRRIIGLKSASLSDHSLVRDDVFFNEWELDVLVGALTVKKLQTIHVSLESLSKLNSIPEHVASKAHKAHELALQSLVDIETHKPMDAYRSASSGYEQSESAYYDPTLVDTANVFPEENKYAVYLPLFLPLAIPVIFSIIRVIRYALFGSRTKADKRKVE